jgi:hypothetical protein
MASAREIKERVAFESERRSRLGVPVTAGGVVYLLGVIIVTNQLQHLPTVGVIQAIEPALKGQSHLVESPRAKEITYISHHAFGLVAGGVLQAIGLAMMTLTLLFLLDATRFRAGEPSPAARMLVTVGGIGAALIAIVEQIVRAIRTHEFAVGHDFSNHAVERAAYTGVANVTVEILALVLPIVLVVGMVMTLLRTARVGLIPRWLRTLGIAAAVLMLPFFASAFYTLQVVPAIWLAATGLLFMRRLANDPPAWDSGESIPWPPPAGRGRVAEGSGQDGDTNGRAAVPAAQADEDGADDATSEEPGGEENGSSQSIASGGSSSSRKRRRKRGGRR